MFTGIFIMIIFVNHNLSKSLLENQNYQIGMIKKIMMIENTQLTLTSCDMHSSIIAPSVITRKDAKG